MSCLVLMKAKVGASWCDLYYTYDSCGFFSFQSKSIFWNWVGFEKGKKDIHRLSNFYNWLFICILYQWSFLYWKLKKKIYIGKKSLASQCGLALIRSWVWPLGGVEQFCFVCKICLILILLGSLHVLHFVNHFQGGWEPLNRGKFHVSICAVHIV